MIEKPPSFQLFILIILLVGACSDKSSQTPGNNTPSLVKAPDFEVITITGEKISLTSALEQGKPAAIYFTASWCPKCAKNWPALSKVYPEYKDKLTFVAISIDPSDTEEIMKNLSKEKGFTFPVTAGHPEVMLDFGVEHQATTIGINRDGYIAFRKSYTTLSGDEFRALFDELVN